MIYSDDIIFLLAECVSGNTEAFNRLIEKGHRELVVFNDALSGNDTAFKWLQDNKKYITLAFANAVYSDDKKAASFLLQHKAPELAAVAGAVHKNKQAKMWLENYKLKVYLGLVEKIQQKFEREGESDFKVIFQAPIR